MKITELNVGAKISRRGEYGNDTLMVKVILDEGENWKEVFEAAQKELYRTLGREDLYDAVYSAKRELSDLEERIDAARERWKSVTDFFTAQGIKTDWKGFPVMPALTSGEQQQTVEFADEPF